MKILLISMPDVAPLIMHESAFHLPNLGIASIGANIDDDHDVYVIDLIRKRRSIHRYVSRTLLKIRPNIVGLSSMTWQFDTCLKLIRLIKHLLPEVKIVIGGYHATLMYEEIGNGPEARHIDFIVRGEGEETFRRLINALDGKDHFGTIPSLSFKSENRFVHNERGELLDLATLKLPIRDKRRLTWGYHIMNRSAEVIETSRGCTRTCNFCCIRHMYGGSFRSFPIQRILADIDDIYYNKKCRWIFVSDDNMVLSPERVIELSDAIIARGYRNLHFIVQADCVTISRNDEMVRRMAEAGFKSVFLGIESVSKVNLRAAQKGDIVDAARNAIDICHKYNIMVVGGMIFGFPEDTEKEIMENYRFLKSTGADASYCQILTPYPKTGIRQYLMEENLVTNPDDFSRYNGIWANVRTRTVDAETMQYMVWYHRQNILGWWEPSRWAREEGRDWTAIWMYIIRPLLKVMIGRSLKKHGWKGRYQREIAYLKTVNRFPDLDV